MLTKMAMNVKAKLLENHVIIVYVVVDVTGAETAESDSDDNLASVKHKQVAS